VQWPSAATNFVLQQNSMLTSPSWSNYSGSLADDGTNKSVNIIARPGNAFFRLLNSNGP
jgi:hypothetical protein